MKYGLCITVLAGGLGKRMGSTLPKILHNYNGKPMIVCILEKAIAMNPNKIIIVVGKFIDIIKETIGNYFNMDLFTFAIQEEPLGTGDAIKSTLGLFDDGIDYNNIILNGDTPLLKYKTLKNIYSRYIDGNCELLITGIHISNPTGYGRIIVFNSKGSNIVEEKDCNENEKLINLVNVGIYICKTNILKNIIPLINNLNKQKEYYITDMVKIYKEKYNKLTDLFILEKSQQMEIFNVNTKDELEFVNNNFINCS